MKVLDTDILTLFFQAHSKVLERRRQETDDVVITIISHIEVLKGRFSTLLKAANGVELKRGQQRLDQAERNLRAFPVLPVSNAAADQFESLLRSKAAKQVRRADLLIATIALSHNATLVTRNVKDFKRVPGLRIENWAD